MFDSSKLLKLTTLCVSAWVLSACGGGNSSMDADRAVTSTVPAAAESPYQPTATFQEIMDSVVDPSSDFIWDSVSTTVDAKGIHETKPSTDEQWHELRRRAVLLAEAANLIAVPGRRVANGDKTVEGAEPLDVMQIQQRLDARHAELIGFASALREISVKLVAVADQKDVAAINELGGTLDEVCESCHKVFWYPDEAQSAGTK